MGNPSVCFADSSLYTREPLVRRTLCVHKAISSVMGVLNGAKILVLTGKIGNANTEDSIRKNGVFCFHAVRKFGIGLFQTAFCIQFFDTR